MSTIALAGNPNCGKTTLFNRLTNSRYRVGNRAGVTVAPKSGRWGFHTVVDLPGVYSLTEASAEERAARKYLVSGEATRILNIIDATDLERSLWLTVQLARLGIPMTIALNMSDLLEKSGYKIDIEKLAKRLGVPVILICAAHGEGLPTLAAANACVPNEIVNPREWIAETISQIVQKTGENLLLEKSVRVDRIILHKIFSLPILIAVIGLIFWLTFGFIGKRSGGLCEFLFLGFTRVVEEFLAHLGVNDFLTSLICDGILQAIGSVVPFFSQILILFFCLSLLEDVGYMARVVFITNRFMERFGLDGKAVLPLITGFGCSVPAVMAAQNIDSPKKRAKTVELIPFFSCSAKMPVYIIFASAFFPDHAGVVVVILYLLGILSACIYAKISNPKGEKDIVPFVLELPAYRRPTLQNTLNQLKEKLSDFIKRAGSVLFIAGVAIWFLEHFDFSLHMVSEARDSILGISGSILAPVFVPCGFGTWQVVVSLLAGFIAKEAVISTLNVVYGRAGFITAFTPASAASFLVFILFYPPCVAAISAIGGEISGTGALKMVLRQLAAAWILSAVTYLLFRMMM